MVVIIAGVLVDRTRSAARAGRDASPVRRTRRSEPGPGIAHAADGALPHLQREAPDRRRRRPGATVACPKCAAEMLDPAAAGAGGPRRAAPACPSAYDGSAARASSSPCPHAGLADEDRFLSRPPQGRWTFHDFGRPEDEKPVLGAVRSRERGAMMMTTMTIDYRGRRRSRRGGFECRCCDSRLSFPWSAVEQISQGGLDRSSS